MSNSTQWMQQCHPMELPQAKDVARITQNQENGRHIESQENNAPNRHEGGKLSPKRR